MKYYAAAEDREDRCLIIGSFDRAEAIRLAKEEGYPLLATVEAESDTGMEHFEGDIEYTEIEYDWDDPVELAAVIRRDDRFYPDAVLKLLQLAGMEDRFEKMNSWNTVKIIEKAAWKLGVEVM